MDFDTDSYAAPEPAVKTWPTRAIGAGIVLVCVLLILSLLPHRRENYDRVMEKMKAVIELAKKP